MGYRADERPAPPAKGRIVRQALELLFADYRANGRRSLPNVIYQSRHLDRALGHLDVCEISTAHLERYRLRRLSDGRARATVANEFAILRRALRLALRHGWLERVPYFPEIHLDNARSGFLYPADFRRLVAALDVLDRDVSDLVRWLYLTGWRRGEAQGLRWTDVHVDAGRVSLPARRLKSGHVRHIALGSVLLELLKRRQERRDGRWVFHRQGRQIRRFAGPWARATVAIGQPGLLVHDLRRSFARNALQAGVPQAVIMQIGGWRTNATFYRYAICDESQISRALDSVAGSVLPPAPGTADPLAD